MNQTIVDRLEVLPPERTFMRHPVGDQRVILRLILQKLEFISCDPMHVIRPKY